jgi:hypothetical protein
MTLDTTQQRFGPSLNFDYSAPAQPPAFSNPWSSSSPSQHPPAGSSLFVGSQSALNPSIMAGKPPQSRASTSSTSSMASYGGAMPVPNTSAGKFKMPASIVYDQLTNKTTQIFLALTECKQHLRLMEIPLTLHLPLLSTTNLRLHQLPRMTRWATHQLPCVLHPLASLRLMNTPEGTPNSKYTQSDGTIPY